MVKFVLLSCIFLFVFRVVSLRGNDPTFIEKGYIEMSFKPNFVCFLNFFFLYYFLGQPYLWARLDRKPNKLAEKRFKNFLHSKQNSKEFFWNVEEDFKPVPECWIPAKEIEQLNGNPMPDENGHIPGWVPVEKNNKQYCWHSSVVNYEFEIALVLRHHPDDPGLLEISAVPLSDLLEQTLELIGTNINGNPYGLGSKKHPLHLLIPHGAFQIRNLPTLKHSDLLSWF
uniref:RNA ligase 1 n=1 Tax=Capra hircus TaxID=9925 RepID=A0A8C2R5A2_CAPHI